MKRKRFLVEKIVAADDNRSKKAGQRSKGTVKRDEKETTTVKNSKKVGTTESNYNERRASGSKQTIQQQTTG